MVEFRSRTSRLLSVALLAMIAVEVLGLVYLKRLPFSRITVLNYDVESDLYWHPQPGMRSEFTDSRGVTHVIVEPDYGVLRRYGDDLKTELGDDLAAAATDLDRAVLLRRWARDQYEFSDAAGKVRMFDYDALRQGRLEPGGVLCDGFATLLVGAALSRGLPARLVHLNTTGGVDSEGHYVAEIYLRAIEQWVVQDPANNCYYADRGTGAPLSALDLHRLARQNLAKVEARVERGGATTPLIGIDPDRYYRHFQIVNRTDLDRYRLHLFGPKLLFLNWVGDGAAAVGQKEAVLRVAFLFVWPACCLVVGGVLILGARPRVSLLLLVGRKPVRPEYRE